MLEGLLRMNVKDSGFSGEMDADASHRHALVPACSRANRESPPKS
jgi:hypothetical protein